MLKKDFEEGSDSIIRRLLRVYGWMKNEAKNNNFQQKMIFFLFRDRLKVLQYLSERVSVMKDCFMSPQESHFIIWKIFSIIFCCFIDLISEELGKKRNVEL